MIDALHNLYRKPRKPIRLLVASTALVACTHSASKPQASETPHESSPASSNAALFFACGIKSVTTEVSSTGRRVFLGIAYGAKGTAPVDGEVAWGDANVDVQNISEPFVHPYQIGQYTLHVSAEYLSGGELKREDCGGLVADVGVQKIAINQLR